MITIYIPAVLRALMQNQETVQVQGTTVREVLDALEAAYPGVKDRLCFAGRVRRFVDIFVKDANIADLQGLDTPVTNGDEVTIMPAVAGGS